MKKKVESDFFETTGITIAKAEGCTKKGKEQAQAVKKQKQK